MGLHDEAKLDQKFMELAKLMNIHLNHFPKQEKYGLALRRGAADSAVSILGHARHTHSMQHMLRYAKEHHHDHH